MESRRTQQDADRSRLAAFRYRLWWTWARFRLGSDVLAAAGYRPPGERGDDG